jgi:AraC-like DNA-binding protein
VLERFGPVHIPYVRARSAVRRGNRHALGFDVIGPIEPAARIALLELVAVARKNLFESVLGDSIASARFDFDYPAPAWAARYEEELGAPARFGRPETAISIPVTWLDRECSTSDPVLFATSIERLEARKRQLESREFVVVQVEDLLSSSGDPGLSVEEVARSLGMSRRSLTRHLSEVGTTYRALRDDHRRRRAEQLLRNRDLDIGEVAWRLGYRDLANFGRAARRWFGTSPGRYRREAAPRAGDA